MRLLFRADPLLMGGTIALLYRQLGKIRPFYLMLPLIGSLLFLFSAPEFAVIALYFLTGMLCGCVLLIAQAVPIIKAALSLRPLAYLGKISYGIYVYHLLGLGVAGKVFPASMVTTSVAGLVLTILASMASYHLYEARFLRLKRKFTVVESRPI